MNEKVNAFIENTELNMETIVENFNKHISKYRTGRPQPDLVANIKVECYGSLMPIKQIANINIPEAHEILIKPYDPKQLASISRALNKSDLNLPVNVETSLIRIKIPPLTEDIRKKLSRQVQSEVEGFKIKIRNERRDAIHIVKKELTSEGERAIQEEHIQKLTDDYTHKIQMLADNKIQELMTL